MRLRAIDGANAWQSFSKITMPLLMPTMVVVLVLSLIRAVQVFDIVFAFTGGGPGTATLYLVQYIYNYGFSSPNKQFGLAAAASIVMAGCTDHPDRDPTRCPAGGELR